MSSNSTDEENEESFERERCCFRKLTCLCCCPPWPTKSIPKAVLKPPQPSYCLTPDPEGKHYFLFFERAVACFYEVWRHKIDCFFATTSRGKKIACMFFKPIPNARYTTLYSHGNCSDLGGELTFCLRLGLLMDCNVFSYDYCGYGASADKPSGKDIFADMNCAWDTLRTRYGVLQERIILYGRSLGTVPTVEVASRQKIAAVVLLSPITSANRAAFQVPNRSWCCDRFPSIDKLPKVNCPILVIHGTNDDVINLSHSVSIYKKCPEKVDPLWVVGAGHDDIQFHLEYLERLRKFATVDLDLNIYKEI